jgi:hypothetical protein
VTQSAQPQELIFPDEPFRAEQPKAGAPRPFRLPEVQTFKLKSGIAVYLVEQHTLPIVSLDLSFDGGAIPKASRRACHEQREEAQLDRHRGESEEDLRAPEVTCPLELGPAEVRCCAHRRRFDHAVARPHERHRSLSDDHGHDNGDRHA